ncbi:MAG TPA: acyl-CoA dehydrogenase family protein [Actinocrinis sp.]|nr:acyl-CoA dehydrogenase family protein [Actinocrinis sp.]
MGGPGEARYRLAERIERYLGDPADPGTVFSYANCVALDEREEFPAEICRRLDAWGVPDYYVPAEFGGRLDDYEQFVQLMRALSRRDLTVAVGHGKTYLGAAAVWVAGSRRQAERLAADIRAGTAISLGLTERAHGSDLLAGQVAAIADTAAPGTAVLDATVPDTAVPDATVPDTAVPDATAPGTSVGRYALTGEKWLINNATRGGQLALLARTDPAGGPRGFSMLLVDKRELPSGGYTCLDKVRTHGIRGADISGIEFHGAEVGAEALIGAAGSGIETILKTLQLTRIMCAALSLGAADHALGLVLDFARTRELYGRTLIELPKARHTLAASGADLLAAEALAIVASRAVHTLTGELSVVSAVAKYLIPTETDALIARLSRQLGARAYLKEVYARGMFQKIDRDHRVVGLFDGNTLVNLSSLINQFRTLARSWERALQDPRGGQAAAEAFRLDAPLPPVDPSRLSLTARGGSAVLASLPASVELLERAVRREADAGAQDGADPAVLRGALGAARRVSDAAARVHREMARDWTPATAAAPRAFETARRYAVCFAAAACLGLWAHNRPGRDGGAANGRAYDRDVHADPLWRDGVWLRAALDRLLARLGDPSESPRTRTGAAADPTAAAAYDRLLSHLCGCRDRGELFSLLPLALAGGGTEPRGRGGGAGAQ